MDPLRFAIVATPIAAYLLMVGLVNLRPRPLMVTGAGDLAALGLALSGIAFVGPIALFRPEAATAELGDFVWLLLLALYWLTLTLVVMVGRPRLVVYNLSAEELRPVLSEAIRQLDPGARWAGDSVSLPKIGVQAHVDGVGWTRNTSLIASGGRQDLQGWRRLSRALERTLRGVESRPSRIGSPLLGIGVGLLIVVVSGLLADPQEVAVAWRQLFAFGTA